MSRPSNAFLPSLVTAALVFSVGVPARSASYVIENVTPVSAPWTSVSVQAINGQGKVVGYRSYTNSRTNAVITKAFVYDEQTNVFTNLGSSLGGSSLATCVSSSGDVAGVCWIPNGAGVTEVDQSGFVVHNGQITTFLSPAGGEIHAVTAVNSLGHVCGTYYGVFGYIRSFFWDGATSTDLGDPVDFGSADNNYLWPSGLNEADQIVGTVYDFGPPIDQPSAAFVWQSGVLSLLDQERVYGDTAGLVVNDLGVTLGSYSIIIFKKQLPTRVIGAFLVDNQGTTLGLGNLGGGRTAGFSLSNNGLVTGTSYSGDGTLHLFNWTTAGLADKGFAGLTASDTSFHLSGANAGGDMSGSVMDASGTYHGVLRTSTASLMDVATLLPAGYSLVADANTRVLINDARTIACTGTLNGQAAAVFLAYDSDSNGLPDWWENRYFGHTGVVPNADEDGDGLTNLQEYQQGKDPTDYFNAQLTNISIKSGNNQSAGPNAWVANPLVVKVIDGTTNAAKVNAPIVFSSTTAMLATSPGGTGSSSVQARSNALGEAVVYLKLPGAGVVQEVTASGRSGVNTAQVVFYAEIAQLAPSPSSFSLFLNEGEVQERTITLVNSTDHKIKYSIDPPVASSAQTQAPPQDASNPEYNWTDSRTAADVFNRPAYVWHDISATGTLLSNFRDASSNPTIDDGFQQVNLPFSFPFYGNAFTSCFVSTNGYVTFGTGSVQYPHYALPGTNMPPNLIAPLFKDLYITPPGKVYYRADSGKAVIQYDNIGAPRYTFQIVMEMSGNITFYYKTMNANSPNSPININDATVGIQNGDTITPHGRQVAFNRSYIGNGFAVRFYRPNLLPMVWARLQYDSGGVSAGDHASVGLTLDSTGLVEGVYTTTLHLKDDGGNAVGPDIPITLHVSGDATVDLDHDRLPDSWENGRFGNLNESANGDPDRDGLSNLLEYRLGSDPRNPDSNGDGVLDGLAYKAGISVTNPDMDGDGISNAMEIQRGANPFVRDSDGDGVPDGQDAYPSDPAGWQYSSGWLNDHTPPTITITSPTSGITLLN